MRSPLLITTCLALGAIAGCLATLVYRTAAPSAASPAEPSGAPLAAPSASSLVPSRQAGAKDATSLANAFRAGDARALRDALLAEGVSLGVARAAVERMAHERLNERIARLRRQARSPHDGARWWIDGGRTPEIERQIAQLEAAVHAELVALFPGVSDQAVVTAPDQDRSVAGPAYDFLPGERRELLSKIERDYDEMIREAELAVAGFELPSDREKIELLKAEKERDLTAALTPQERAELELRASPLAEGLQELARSAAVSEDEYRKLFALAKSRHDQEASADVETAERQAVEYQRQIAAVLGEERYRNYTRQLDPDYSALKNAAERFQVPLAKVDGLYAQRDKIAQEAHRLGADATLDAEQRRAAGAQLAEQLRRAVTSAFAAEPEAASAYLSSNLQWLGELEQGARIELLPDGSVRSVAKDR